jgi:Holliday junction resolvase
MRRAAKIDANQPEIVKALGAAGCSVWSLAAVGQGFPDLIVGRQGRNYLLEVKDGSLAPSKRKLTQDERDFHAAWRGHVVTVNTVAEALDAVGL